MQFSDGNFDRMEEHFLRQEIVYRKQSNQFQVYGNPWKSRKRLRVYAEGGWVVEIANRQLDN